MGTSRALRPTNARRSKIVGVDLRSFAARTELAVHNDGGDTVDAVDPSLVAALVGRTALTQVVNGDRAVRAGGFLDGADRLVAEGTARDEHFNVCHSPSLH